jgi:nucleoid DNA-binding protein
VEISQYIKELLMLNDCVIIPEFGGFIANYKPASSHNNQFFPPAKEIAFNSKLTSNDGLLINYISDVEGINYFEAKEKLNSFIEETLMNLERNRNVYFDGIGYLHYDSRENLQFEPQLMQNLLADSYGLQNFSYERLFQRTISKPVTKVTYHEPIPINFSRNKIKRFAVAVPLLLALALIPVKHQNVYLSKSDLGLWETLSETAPISAPSVEVVNTSADNSAIATPSEQEFKYYIIGGSFRSEQNAEKYIQQLSAEGYSGKNLGIFNGLHRIAMIGFATMGEAQKELNSLLGQKPQSGVWIYVNE